MNYVEWCELMLTKLDEESDRNNYVRNNGIDHNKLEKIVWGDRYEEIKGILKEEKRPYVLEEAVFGFRKLG